MGENIDRRYLGALKCVDRAAGFHLTRLMQLQSDELEFIRNRSNLYVIKNAAGLESHVDAFDAAPDTPATGSLDFSVSVVDPSARYLPRAVEISLPRDADPANSDNADSIFNPIEVALYPSSNASLAANWSAVRVSVTDPAPVAGALLRVIRNSDDAVLSSGLTDRRGEGLVIVPGIPITQFADDEDGDPPDDDDPPPPVVVSEIAGRLEVSVAANTEWPANPDVLEANHAANLVATETLTLRTGQTEKVTIQLT